MNLQPNEDQTLLRDAVERFLAESRPEAEAGAAAITSAEWRSLAELGLAGLAVSEDAGGLGGGPAELMLVGE